MVITRKWTRRRAPTKLGAVAEADSTVHTDTAGKAHALLWHRAQIFTAAATPGHGAELSRGCIPRLAKGGWMIPCDHFEVQGMRSLSPGPHGLAYSA